MADKPNYEELERRVRQLEQENVALQQSEENHRLLSSITENMSESVAATNSELRLSEEKFRLIAENSAEIIWQIDLEGNVIYASPSVKRILGYTPEEATGLAFGSFIYEAQMDAAAKVFNKAVAGEKYQLIEIMGKKKDGACVPIEVSVTPIRKGERIIAVEGIARDVSKRKRIEARLQESESRYRTIFENNLNPIAIIDTDGRYLEANRAFYDFTRTDPRILLQMSAFDFAPPDRKARQEEDHRPAWSSGGIFETDYLIGDRIKTLELSVTPIRYQGREAVVGIGVDTTERKKSEAALRESEERFRDLSNMLPQIIFEMDMIGKLTFVNQNAIRTFEYTNIDFESGLNAIEMIAPAHRNRAAERMLQIMNGIESTSGNEYIAIKKDGTEFPVIIYSSQVLRNGTPAGLRGIMVDISDRKLAEEKLRKSEEKYRAIFENVNEGILIAQGNKLKLVNRAAEQILGYTAEILTSRAFTDFIHPDDRDTVFERYKRRMDGEDVETGYAFRIVTGSGEERWVEIHSSLLNWEDQLSTINFISDITERKIAQTALRESEEKFRSMVEQTGEMLFLHDLNGKLIDVNFAAVKNTGYSRDELKEMSVFDIDPDARSRDDMRLYWGSMRPADTPVRFEVRHRRKDGSIYPAEVSVSKVVFQDGDYILGLARDISELQKAMEALRESEALLNRSQQIAQIGSFIWNIRDETLVWSKNMYTVHGIDEQSFAGNLNDISYQTIHPDDRDRVGAEIAKMIETGKVLGMEFRIVLPDGQERLIRSDGEFELNSAGTPIRCIGVHQDITEQKDKDQELQESEEKFSRAFHMSPVPMTITSLDDGRFLDINDAFVFQTGYSRDMAIGSTSTEIGFATIEDRSRMIDNLNKEGRVDNIELSVRRADGSIMTCLYSATPIEIRGKKQLLSAAVDISGEKRIKEELSESRARFEKMLSVVPDMISIHDLDMNILYSNWQGFASIPRDKRVLNTKCYKTYRGFDHICPDCKARNVIELNKPFQSEEKLPDGRWIDLRVMPINDDDGKLEMFLEWVRDITESKTQQIELQSQKRLVEGVLDSIKDVIGIQLKDHTVLRYNRAGYELLGITEEEVKNKKCYHLIGKSKPCEPCATRIAVKSKKLETIEKYFPELGRHFLCTSNPILDENGEISYIIEQLTDITELRKKEEIFRQSQKMESVGRLAGGVAHDYNNMLSVILGYTEMLIESIATDHTSYESLIQIQNAAKRSADITRQLLAFARRQTIAPKILDINEVVEGMLKMLNRLIGEDIDLAWMPGKSLWPVRLDPSQIDQILANLCVNARDAISSVGKITIETSNISFDAEYCKDHPGAGEGDYILLAVSDNGEGMDTETIQNIFEPFFTTKSEGIGTGLGLATVYGIVKQNDGFINVYSEPEKGSTFKIYLPRDRSEIDKKKVEVSSEIPKSRGETVLIVEDEVSILNMGKQMLQRLGYNVLSANKPKDAIELAKRHHGKIDLLITDVVMPEMSGRELSEEFSTRYSSVKTLYMSGYTANVIAHHGVLEEGVKFIQKPFSRKDLAVKVREVLDNGTE